MVKFIEVDPDEIPNFRESHRGRVSYPILKSFLETGLVVGQLDKTGLQQSHQSLYSSLNAYIKNHELPIEMFSRGGEIYLARQDLDDEGKPVLSTREALKGGYNFGEEAQASSEEAPPINKAEIDSHVQEAEDYTR